MNGRLASGAYRILSAEFETAVHSIEHAPPYSLPEIVFAGRSNSGKSTLLNALCGRKALARVSKTPGRTQAINYFRIRARREGSVPAGGSQDIEAYFVDLPGYGHAEVSKELQRNWSALLGTYLRERAGIAAIAVLADCRRPVSDLEEWFFSLDSPAEPLYVLTKCDKVPRSRLGSLQAEAARKLGIAGSSVFAVSAGAKKGKDGVEQLRSALFRLVDPAD